MSMLSAQCERLRDAANGLDAMSLHAYAREFRDASDTIADLRLRCQELQEKEWQSGFLQTCFMETTNASDYDWRCNECGEHVSMCSGKPRFCPSCGRRVVS